MHESGADRGLRGLEIQWGWLDETREMTEYTYDIVSACLRGFGSGPYLLRLTSTPNGRDWMWRRLIEPATHKVVLARTRDNRFLPDSYEDGLRAQYSAEMAAQELDAAIVVMGKGRMYRFDQVRHVQPSKLHEGYPLIFSLDFNTSPMCGVVMQVDRKQRRAWVCDELIIEQDALTGDMMRLFRKHYPDWKAGVWYLGDEAGEASSTKTPESDIDIMRALMKGYPGTSRCLNDGHKPRVVDRVNIVNALLDPAVGEPKLLVDPTCKGLIMDLEDMRWQEGVRKADKRDKMQSHLSEALGYALAKLLPISVGNLLTGRNI